MTGTPTAAILIAGALLAAGCTAAVRDANQEAARAWAADPTQGWQEDHWDGWQMQRQVDGEIVRVQGRDAAGNTVTGTERRIGHLRFGIYHDSHGLQLTCSAPRVGSIEKTTCF